MTVSKGDPSEPDPPVTTEAAEVDREKRDLKARKKLRSAWISFVGRIVAQVIGAAATVALGLIIANRVQAPPREAPAPVASETAKPRPVRARSGTVSVAVLPLDNFSGDPAQDYFADGMTEALIADLARIRALHVISRTSVMSYKHARKPLPQIAQELGVDAVIEGSVVLSGKRVRVTAQLVDAHDDRHLWSETYDREVKDVLALQSDVARSVAQAVNVVLSPNEQERLARSRPVDPAAHALYLRGRHEWNKRTREGFGAARAAFEQAIAVDPNYAPAYAGLADAWNVASWSFYDAADAREAMPRARAAAEKALALDETLGEAHASLGSVLFRYAWDFAGAERELRRALEINPGYGHASQWLSSLYAALGRSQEALTEVARARQIDPISALPRRTAAIVLYFAGRFADAEREVRAEMASGEAPGAAEILAEILLAQGRGREAAATLQTAFGSVPTEPGPRLLLATARAAAGDRGPALAAAEDVERLASHGGRLAARPAALLLAQLGDRDRTLRLIDRTIEERSEFAVWLKVHPLLASVRPEPAFQDRLRRVGFPAI
jgi:TolB-like protein/Flp pilus assembly protein TadD